MSKPHQSLSASIYVGDLSPDVTEGLLFEIFNSVGPVVSIRVCRDTITRRSLGYAYVNFHSIVDAERALDTLNNTLIKDKPCRIMWVQRDPSIRKSGVGNIFIKNLDTSIGHKELFDTFSIFGNILSCKVVMDENGNSKGYGFVHFESAESAENAVRTVNDKMLRSKKVYVGKFVPKREFIKQKEASWTNVYVKDLDLSVTEEQLRKEFAEQACGGDASAITSCVIMRDNSTNSKGFGFVNFSKHEFALKAVEKLHNATINGKTIWCGRAQKFAERQQELKKKYAQLKMQRISKFQGINLYIKNLEDEITEERLDKEFSAFGTIHSCKIMLDDHGNSRGFGFVCYTAPEEAQRAITEMNSRVLQGCNKPLYVALHEPAEIRKQKLAQRNASRTKLRPGSVPNASPSMYGGGPGQPVYYPGNVPSGYVYPPQAMLAPRRGWPQAQPQPQFQQMPYSVIPNMQGRGGRGGRGNSIVSGRGNRVNNRRNNAGQPTQAQMQDPSIIHAAAAPILPELTLQQLLTIPEDQQKVALGELLYPLVQKIQPNLCGKITGMFLDSGWTIEELFSLLHNESKLNEKVEQAVTVLQRVQPPDQLEAGAQQPTDQ